MRSGTGPGWQLVAVRTGRSLLPVTAKDADLRWIGSPLRCLPGADQTAAPKRRERPSRKHLLDETRPVHRQRVGERVSECCLRSSGFGLGFSRLRLPNGCGAGFVVIRGRLHRMSKRSAQPAHCSVGCLVPPRGDPGSIDRLRFALLMRDRSRAKDTDVKAAPFVSLALQCLMLSRLGFALIRVSASGGGR